MQGVNVEKRIEAVLIKFKQTDQDQRPCQQMRDIEAEPVHQKLPDTKRSSVANNPSISAAPRNSGTRNTRILAIDVSNSANSMPPTASFATYVTVPSASAGSAAPLDSIPQGTNKHIISEV